MKISSKNLEAHREILTLHTTGHTATLAFYVDDEFKHKVGPIMHSVRYIIIND